MAVYEGNVISGKPEGFGKIYFRNKSYFEGEFLNGLDFMELLYFLIQCPTKRGRSMTFKSQGRNISRILKKDTLMRGCGEKIYSMVMGFKSLGIKIK